MNGFANYQHFLNTSKDVPTKREAAKPNPTIEADVQPSKSVRIVNLPSFTEWLAKHRKRDSPLGDLAQDCADDGSWPNEFTLDAYRNHLVGANASWEALETLDKAWKTYKAYLKRSESKTAPLVKRPVRAKTIADTKRKIVFVKGIKPLHYAKRVREAFEVGAEAWVSFNGRKALPVTITESDDRHYSVRIVAGKDAGNINSLFRDEVRSTPELACLNCVTL